MIVITGGSGRLGQELVKLFKADNKTVVSIARHKNPEADHNISCDFLVGGEVTSAAKDIESINEPLEAIISAAGLYNAAPLGKISEEEIELNMAIHAKAPMLLESELIDRIKKDGTDIVNISSIAAINTSTGAPAYSASKWALRGFSADLRLALKEYPSRVVSLFPAAFGPEDDNNQMNVQDVAKFIKQLLDLPKTMEVSEIIVNLKAAK
ncbi:MAG TPA: SDR family oxidoreductase [Candidatus Saccharimonadales bacterium]|nr:SDR family oxidoreductase [Candidatus Saccharimonadales bacterium]